METELIEKLRTDFPEFRFKQGKKFAFRPPGTIMIGPKEPEMELLLLHEVSHAVLKHENFDLDIERLRMEMEAWEKTRELCAKYGVVYNEEKAQDELDTYRDWLHKKSRCPACGLTRFQDLNGLYHCPRCENFTS